MRHEKIAAHLHLARRLASSAEGLTLDEIAAEVGVNRRTAERMRDALREVFPTFEEVSDGRGKRFRIAGGIEAFFRAPTADELAELDMAARALAQEGGHARAALLQSLDGKVRSTLRPQHKQRIAPDLDALVQGEGLVMQAGPKPLVDRTLLAVLRDALKAPRLCVFDYRAGNGHDYRRRVVPYGILYGRTYYLVGPEHGKEQPMLWRFDRMAALTLDASCAAPPPDFSLRTYAARSFGAFQETSERVALRFAPSAAAEARRFDFHPTQAFEEQPDGAVVVRFEAGGLLELAHHLFTWGDGVDILEPERLRTVMRDTITAALAHHTQSSTPDKSQTVLDVAPKPEGGS